MEPGKLYKVDKTLFEHQRRAGAGMRRYVHLFHQISSELDRPLHHYCLYAETDKPPLLFVGFDCLYELDVFGLGSRLYIYHPAVKIKGSRVNAGKFLHEEEIVWVVSWELDGLTQAENETNKNKKDYYARR